MTTSENVGELDSLLCYSVYAASLSFGRFYQTAFADTGFTYPKFITLMALNETGPVSLADLANRIGVEPNTLSPLAKKMQGFGLIDRVRDPKDERRVLLTLLPYGKKVLNEAHAVVQDAWDQLGLSAEEVEKSSRFLASVRTRLEEMPPKRQMTVPERDEETDKN